MLSRIRTVVLGSPLVAAPPPPPHGVTAQRFLRDTIAWRAFAPPRRQIVSDLFSNCIISILITKCKDNTWHITKFQPLCETLRETLGGFISNLMAGAAGAICGEEEMHEQPVAQRNLFPIPDRIKHYVSAEKHVVRVFAGCVFPYIRLTECNWNIRGSRSAIQRNRCL